MDSLLVELNAAKESWASEVEEKESLKMLNGDLSRKNTDLEKCYADTMDKFLAKDEQVNELKAMVRIFVVWFRFPIRG